MTQASSAANTPQRKTLIRIYVVAVSLYWVSLYLYAPTLPTHVKATANDLAMAGVVLSMYGLWQALVRFPLGIVSDWIGRRKPFILAGFALSAAGAAMMGLADGVPGLLVGRAITGLAAGTWVPLVVLFSSLFPPEDSVKASSLLTLVGTISRVVATGVTGSLNNLSGGYTMAFMGAAVAGILALIIVLPSKEQARPPKAPSLQSIWTLVARRDVLLPSLLSAVGQYANWTATFSFIPILAEDLGATGVTLSMLLSLNLVIMAVGNLGATALANRIGARRLVYIGFALLFVGLIGSAMAPSLVWIFAAQVCIGLAQGVTYPVLMGLCIRYVDDSQRTMAMGLHQAIYAVGMFAGPAVSGVVAKAIGIRPMFGVTGFAALVIGLLVARQLGPKSAEN